MARHDDDRRSDFERNRDRGRGYRGRSEQRDYDAEHAGYDRAGDRGRARTGRLEDVPDGRWDEDADYQAPDYAPSGRDDAFLDEVPPRRRGTAPERMDFQSDDFDVHSYGRYGGRDRGGSGKGQRRGPDADRVRGDHGPGSGRRAMDGRDYAATGADDEYPRSGGPHAGRGPKGYRRAPERIHEDVCERMTAHGHLDAREVEVEVDGDEVTLRGTVSDRGAKRLADDLAASVRGVHDVHNRLTIRREAPSGGDETADAG